MKYIIRKSIASIPLEGKISDTLNVEDKVNNAPSINLVQQMTGIPVDGIISFDGTEDEIPEGYEKVETDGGIETITNENGKAIKFPDGTMICLISKKVYDLAMTNSYGNFYTGFCTVPFPVPFVGAVPSAVCGACRYGTSASWGMVSSCNLEVCVVRGYDAFSRASGTETLIQVTAIGRWK